MYWFIAPTKKLWSILVLGTIILLISACSSTTTNTRSADGMNTTYPATYPVDSSGSYIVQPGDTLYGVAKRYGLSFRDVANWNNIAPPYAISPGQRLIVYPPSGGSYPVADNTYTQGIPVETSAPATPRVISPVPNSVTSTTTTDETGGTYHAVQPGETLYSIAIQYGQNVRNVATWNNLAPPYHLVVGQTLLVSPNASTTVTDDVPISKATKSAKYHLVKRGDTLYSIAQRYGYTPGQIALWNHLKPPYQVAPGHKLLIAPTTTTAKTRTTVATRKATKAPTSKGSYHTVAAGETLYSISRRYGHTPEQVAAWNNIAPPYTVHVGQQLLVTSSSTAPATAKKKKVKAKKAVVSSSTMRIASVPQKASKKGSTTIRPTAPSRSSVGFHTVAQGESLASIAAKYNLTTHELAIWNGIGSPYSVYPGQKLLIVPP